MQATYLTAGALVALMRLTWLEPWRKKKFAWSYLCTEGEWQILCCASHKLQPQAPFIPKEKLKDS